MADARPAAAVVLLRETGHGQELFWVRRGAEVSLGSGFHAFPGGRVDEADRELAAAAGATADLDEATVRVSALRELFEETGVLLGLAGAPSPDALARWRRALLDETCTFAEVLAACGARLDLEALAPAGRWVTPLFVPTRFDARFYAARLPAGQAAEVWPGELVAGEWITPAAALECWEQAQALLHPPALHVLRCLAAAPWPACTAALQQAPDTRAGVPQTMEFQAGVRLVPLRAPTLPPDTHTHCYITGDRELLVFDPGAHDPAEQRFLFACCDALLAEGRRVRAIVLTHEHVDHVGAAAALRARLGVPVWAHPLTAERLGPELEVDGVLADGERLELQGRLRQAWRAVFTPGHARGHLCFFEEGTRVLLAGDMLAGRGTVMIPAAPEGDMADYVASLEKLARLVPRFIYPAHGPPIVDGPGRIRAYLVHRAERERTVLAALAAAGRAHAEELVPAVYSDVAPGLHGLAAQSLRAVLEKLAKEGRVARGPDGRYAPAG